MFPDKHHVSLVVMPLLNLIKDQEFELNKLGVASVSFTSDDNLTTSQIDGEYNDIINSHII